VIDLHNPLEVRAFVRDLQTKIADLAAAAEDATRPIGERELGRRAARRIVLDSNHAIRNALVAAGLAEPDETPPASGPRA
jgi:hypothetical protein